MTKVNSSDLFTENEWKQKSAKVWRVVPRFVEPFTRRSVELTLVFTVDRLFSLLFSADRRWTSEHEQLRPDSFESQRGRTSSGRFSTDHRRREAQRLKSDEETRLRRQRTRENRFQTKEEKKHRTRGFWSIQRRDCRRNSLFLSSDNLSEKVVGFSGLVR